MHSPSSSVNAKLAENWQAKMVTERNAFQTFEIGGRTGCIHSGPSREGLLDTLACKRLMKSLEYHNPTQDLATSSLLLTLFTHCV